jgi:hypothetical protein
VFLLVCGVALAQSPAGPADRRPLRPLTDSEVTRYVAALAELVKLGDDTHGALGADPGKARAFATGLAANQRMQKAIESRGFTLETFVDVHWNTMMAYAALELTKHEGEMAKARKDQGAALEKMRAQMPPEQFEQMKRSMSGMTALFDAYRDVPPGNIALAKKHQAQLDAILKR